MNFDKLPYWLRAAVGSTGGLGLFLVAFLDSSVLSFPVINDLLVIRLSIRNPARMPYYALMATLGSVAGCFLLYYLARRGGEAMFRRRARRRAERIRTWTERNAFLGLLVAALLPPPMPFKAFILAAGVLGVSLRKFAGALLVARGFRYFGVGFLAVRYGDAAGRYLIENKLQFTLLALGFLVVSYLVVQRVLRHSDPGS